MNAQLRRRADGFFLVPPPLAAIGSSIALEVSLVGDYFELLDQERSRYYHARPENERAFAHLDKTFCSGARLLVGLSVVLRACMDFKRWEDFRNASRSYSTNDATATFAVDVNVYSLRHHADKVGNMLLRSGVLLQCATYNIGSERYYNPQILEIDGFQERPEEVMSDPDEPPTPLMIENLPIQGDSKPPPSSSNHVELILDSLSHTSILHEIRTDNNRIKSQLMGQVCSIYH